MDRHRLARQQRFVDQEVLAFDKRRVCGNAVAFGKNDDVAARHLTARYPFALAVPDDQRAGAGQVAKSLQHPLCPGFLHDGDRDRQVGEDEQDEGFPPIAERQIDEAARDKQSKHRLADHFEHDLERRPTIGPRQLVVPLGLQPCLSLRLAQTGKAGG